MRTPPYATKIAALLAKVMRRRPRHFHRWRCLGYGGCGWYLFGCDCGERTIG